MNDRQYQQTQTANWRGTLAKNQQKTIMVIGSFLLIYLSLGFLLDLYIHGAFTYNQFQPVFAALITFQIVPWATVTMGGVAIVSLMITFALHDRIMLMGTEYYEVTANNANSLEEKQLYNSVEELKIAAGIRYMPKIYIIDADYMNAFASGYSEKSAMIAVTRGLMNKLNREELQAVLAHELSHIRHGDIKLTLTASVLSNIMLLVVDIFFYNAIFARGGDREDGGRFVFVIILIRYLLPLITILLMLYLSRTREYMADAGSVELMRESTALAHALLKISGDAKANQTGYRRLFRRTKHEELRRAAYIFDASDMGITPLQSLATLFSTHPSIADRLKALGFR